jgi:glycine/D-amino acid oxidase-like deaminating enzyme
MDDVVRPTSFPTAAELARGRVPPDAGIAFKPYWWEAAAPSSDALQLPTETDVAIVGSGFTGLSAALTLLRRGRRCVILDRGVPGYGASTRNGGQIGTGNQKFNVEDLTSERGGGKALELLQEGNRILDYIEHVITTEKIDCHFRRCGRFRGAMRPEHYERLARTMADLNKAVGLESFMVPRAEQHQEIGSDVFYGGTVIVNDASMHPGLYHAGLMERIKAAEGTIAGNAGVTGITRQGQGYRLATAAGEIRSREVIVATDGYTDKLIPQLQRRIVPIVSSLIATGEIPEATFAKLLPKNRVYGNTNRVFSYFRTAPGERRIIWGGRGARFGADDKASSYSHLARDLLRVFPALKDVPITHAWGGLIGQTFDSIPHIGRTAEGIHFALGYCGNAGVSRATYFGHKVALKLLGDAEGGRTAFDELTFPSFPAQPVATRVVPVVEAWMSLRDKFNF